MSSLKEFLRSSKRGIQCARCNEMMPIKLYRQHIKDQHGVDVNYVCAFCEEYEWIRGETQHHIHRRECAKRRSKCMFKGSKLAASTGAGTGSVASSPSSSTSSSSSSSTTSSSVAAVKGKSLKRRRTSSINEEEDDDDNVDDESNEEEMSLDSNEDESNEEEM